VLLVEDEDPVRHASRLGLLHAGFLPLVAASAEEALDLFRGRGAIAAAVIDLWLRDLPGLELLNLLRDVQPDLPCVLTSGVPLEGERPSGCTFLPTADAALALLQEFGKGFEARRARNTAGQVLRWIPPVALVMLVRGRRAQAGSRSWTSAATARDGMACDGPRGSRTGESQCPTMPGHRSGTGVRRAARRRWWPWIWRGARTCGSVPRPTA
jgi:CheY-like chemotaxis protein